MLRKALTLRLYITPLLFLACFELSLLAQGNKSPRPYTPPPPTYRTPSTTGGGRSGTGGSSNGIPSQRRSSMNGTSIGRTTSGANDNRRYSNTNGGRTTTGNLGRQGVTVRRRESGNGVTAPQGRSGRSRALTAAKTGNAGNSRPKLVVPPANSPQVMQAKAALRTNRLNALRTSVRARIAARKAQLAAGGGGKRPPGGGSGGGDNDDPYRAALAGGPHSGFLKLYAQKPIPELDRAVRSYEALVAEHEDKIKNPTKYVPDFSKLDPRQQRALLEREWPSQLRRQRQQLAILRRIRESKK